MHIGIVPNLSRGSGGVYQYSLTMLRTLEKLKECEDEFTVFADVNDLLHSSLTMSNKQRWTIRPLKSHSMQQQLQEIMKKTLGTGPHKAIWRSLWRQFQLKKTNRLNPSTKLYAPAMLRFRSGMGAWFERCGIKLMLYPSPMTLSFKTGIPYVMAIHDLQHRLQ